MNANCQLDLKSGAAPAPGKGDEAAEGSAKNLFFTAQRLKSPRQIRALQELLNGPISREHLDRVAGSSNSPDVVASLRQRGLRIDCDASVAVTDRDGRQTFPGVYRLNPDDRAKAIALLKNSEVTPC
jgi:hypothetical protein